MQSSPGGKRTQTRSGNPGDGRTQRGAGTEEEPEERLTGADRKNSKGETYPCHREGWGVGESN